MPISIYLSVYYLCTYLYLSIHPSTYLFPSQSSSAPTIPSHPSSHYNRKEGLTCGVFWSFNSPFLIIFFHTYFIIEGSLEVKLPTIWTDEKHRWEESEKRREERRSKKRGSQKKEDPGARKGWKVAKHCVFPMICGSGGSNSRLAKAAGAEPSGQMRDDKLHAVVARSTSPSQNVQRTPCSDHF